MQVLVKEAVGTLSLQSPPCVRNQPGYRVLSVCVQAQSPRSHRCLPFCMWCQQRGSLTPQRGGPDAQTHGQAFALAFAVLAARPEE